MKFSCVLLMVFAILPSHLILGQIKTRQPVLGSLLQGYNSSTDLYKSENLYNSTNAALPASNYNIQSVPSQLVFIDKTAEFLNVTRSKMASGICYTEVPTASLVRNLNAIPSGNGSTPTMSRIQICCEGYERNPHIYRKCDPICRDDCPNGICTGPETCLCLPGNVRDYEENCVPICPIGCRNGNCQPDGSCVCKPGYILDAVTKQFCKPHCSKGCGVGMCVAPDTCRCSPKYELSPEGICLPKCENCQHGTCTAPGICNCNVGYIRKENVCEPVCTKGCVKGSCTAPETCTCKPGFDLDATKANCVPHCDKPCLNGFCDGHNICSCNFGYILDETQPNVCKAHCPAGCLNGYCTSPNFCICKPGFIKSGIKGRQTCVPL
ncbi:epidermal growth factor-like protein [Eupeodes corollae]|uniref:epidermal growth factor-like protein n=1 Tax=Eupeodes corollae TaxID=290404 RepID=UPI002492E344|nr:epidermal growth factor-like protein [Eupeodes corollae]